MRGLAIFFINALLAVVLPLFLLTQGLNILFTLSIVLFLVGGFILQGLREIPAEPPHLGVLTLFGERKLTTIKEGWHFFPLYPSWYGFVLVNVTKQNLDFPAQIVRTPDFVELEIPISITITPLKDHLIEYLNAGGKEGVREILNDIVRERLREWAISPDEGPTDWEDAMSAREEAISVLVKAIIGEGLKPTIDAPPNVRTSTLLKFYATPQKTPNKNEEDKYKKNWSGLEEIIEKHYKGEKRELEKLKESIRIRRDIILKIRQGNGEQDIPQLGVRLDRLNIDEIKPKGKLAESAERKANELRELEGDKVKIQSVRERIEELKKLGFSNEQALEIMQTETGKVNKEIKESKWNISQETREMIEKIAPQIISKIIPKGGAK